MALTLGTGSRPDLLILVLNEWAEDVVALVAVVLDDRQLRKHAGRSRHNATGADQLNRKRNVDDIDIIVK